MLNFLKYFLNLWNSFFGNDGIMFVNGAGSIVIPCWFNPTKASCEFLDEATVAGCGPATPDTCTAEMVKLDVPPNVLKPSGVKLTWSINGSNLRVISWKTEW